MRKLILLTLLAVSFLAAPCRAADTSLTVTKVIDATTLELSDGQTVSLIGIQPPEDPEQGKKAAEFTRQLAEGKQVRLDYDVQQRDKYKRLLAYVYVVVCNNCDTRRNPKYEYLDMQDPDGSITACIFLNATLIKSGYAQVMTPLVTTAGQAVPAAPNVKYAELLLKLQKEAREAKRGSWDTVSTEVQKTRAVQNSDVKTFVGELEFHPQTKSVESFLGLDFVLKTEDPKDRVILRPSKVVSEERLKKFENKRIEVQCIHGKRRKSIIRKLCNIRLLPILLRESLALDLKVGQVIVKFRR